MINQNEITGEKITETMEQYLTRIGALNNTPKNETFGRFDRDD